MFANAAMFDNNLPNWNTASATRMYAMFFNASTFNGIISDWEVSRVTDFRFMFEKASQLNGDLSHGECHVHDGNVPSTLISQVGMLER